MMNTPIPVVIMGCGARGRTFAQWIADHPSDARLVAVADPLAASRDFIADLHQIPASRRFADWKQLLEQPKMADLAINTLMDKLHRDSAITAMERGYHMLLEKPMATNLEDCIAIDACRRKQHRIVSVCHSLRYHPCYVEVKRLLDSGVVGEIVTIDQLEGVGFGNHSHSFVRGNWSREATSTFMLLAKSCHDIDILCHLTGKSAIAVNSFGTLSHFTAAHAPAGAPGRCSDGCLHEPECPYSAYKLYIQDSVYAQVLNLPVLSAAQRQEFIRQSPWGRCVYRCDNDVVDHQVVSLQFDGGVTGTFTMSAFAPAGRMVRIHGTHGYMEADIDANLIKLTPFWGSAAPATIQVPKPAADATHGGADDNTMCCLIRAIRTGDSRQVLTSTEESLRTHRLVFAAEQSRIEKRTVVL